MAEMYADGLLAWSYFNLRTRFIHQSSSFKVDGGTKQANIYITRGHSSRNASDFLYQLKFVSCKTSLSVAAPL